MTNLGSFRAVNASGLMVHRAADVTALALLFERVYFPRNLEIIKEFARRYRIHLPRDVEDQAETRLTPSEDGLPDPFADLDADQQKTVLLYLRLGHEFAVRYSKLYGPVFETDFYEDGQPLKVKLVEQGPPGGKNLYEVSHQPGRVTLNEETFSNLVERGYQPVVTIGTPAANRSRRSAKELAQLLAMDALRLVLPATQPARGEVILEARERLRDQLPPFWSAMLKMSTEARRRIADCKTDAELRAELRDLVDSTVLPAVIDLRHKLEAEKKQWARRILSPLHKGLRLIVGNPFVNQAQIMSSALVLGADVAASVANDLAAIEALKRDAGLTFLVDAADLLNAKAG